MGWKGHGKAFKFRVYAVHEIPPEDEEHTPYVGDEDTLFEVDMEESMAGWTNCVFKILKPDGTAVDWGAETNGNKLEYTIVTDDFNKKGWYTCTPYGEAP